MTEALTILAAFLLMVLTVVVMLGLLAFGIGLIARSQRRATGLDSASYIKPRVVASPGTEPAPPRQIEPKYIVTRCKYF